MVNETYQIRVDDSQCGKRLDLFLAGLYPQFSRTKLQKIIKSGLLTVNAAPSRVAYRVEPGDEIRFTALSEESPSFAAEHIPLAVVYEDENLMVIDKPAGMVVHPGAGNMQGTLLNAVLGLGKNDLARAGIVHRLDKETSGLIIIAKNEPTYVFLQQQFKSRRVQKKYLALVWGKLKAKEGLIDAPISRSKKDRQKMRIDLEGRPAQTQYKVLKEYELGNGEKLTLLEISPKTGRTHQIRVHLKALGHPVLGDKTYGRKNILDKKLNRQFLHAGYLKFNLPGGEKKEINLKLPQELELFLSHLPESS